MRKIFYVILGIIIITGVVLGVYFFRGGDDVEDAIDRYEDGDYADSIISFNNLLKVLDYESSEKVHYYRCKAINKLAEKLEIELTGDANDLSAGDREGMKELVKEFTGKLSDINKKIGGDLVIAEDNGKMRILSRGAFYDEFVSRYNGSRYVEDLDFEELQKIARASSHKVLSAVANFYSRYPNTVYLSQIVKLLFDSMQKGVVQVKGKEQFLKRLILQFGSKYPTSSEFYRIYTCKSDSVNLRNSPGTKSDVIGKIGDGEILIQLEKTMDTFQIGDTRDYWYRVASLRGIAGWIFGKFLAPIDLSALTVDVKEEKWSFQDIFSEWSDSNTPKNWMHMDEADKSSISFYSRAGINTLRSSSPAGRASGLYRRVVPARSFVLLSRARFVKGGPLVLMAYVMTDLNVFILKLMDGAIEISGRRIPVRTQEWHEYRIECDNGIYGKLLLDGEVLSSRITPVKDSNFKRSGIYFMCSSAGEESHAESEFIKIR